MNTLVLSPYPDAILDAVVQSGDDVYRHNDPIDLEFLLSRNINFVVSYGYRHIISRDIVDRYRGLIINLHPSYLPYGRGADPNFWSFFEATRKGITIHLIDEGIDTGDILVQVELEFSDSDTLATSYWALRTQLEELFRMSWPDIKDGRIATKKQIGEGTYHMSKELKGIFPLLPNGWDTPVSFVTKLAAKSSCAPKCCP